MIVRRPCRHQTNGQQRGPTPADTYMRGYVRSDPREIKREGWRGAEEGRELGHMLRGYRCRFILLPRLRSPRAALRSSRVLADVVRSPQRFLSVQFSIFPLLFPFFCLAPAPLLRSQVFSSSSSSSSSWYPWSSSRDDARPTREDPLACA